MLSSAAPSGGGRFAPKGWPVYSERPADLLRKLGFFTPKYAVGVGPYANKREEVFGDWKKGIAELSTCHNVVVKLGGLGMPVCGFRWNERKKPISSIELAKAMAPYYHWCIDKFGTNRCMFESNFPVDKVSYSYTVLWNSFKRIVKSFSPEEKASLFHDTAARVYRLN